METLASGAIFLFEGFRLDRRGLFRLDERGVFVPVAIGSRALDLLRVLVAAEGDLLSKDEIMAAVWPATVVEDNNLTVQISTLRRILDQGRSEGSCIQTVAGRGYRFVPPVTKRADDGDRQSTAVSRGGSRLPPRLSIVVLPFINLSDDPDQEYFADGITDDLTTDLSRISGMFVISRNTAFTYKDKRVDTRQIGRELGVRYVLEGSVRRSSNQVRVNAQLIDAESDAHLWAERFNGDTSDQFLLQDEVTSRIANALGVELIVAEVARSAEHPDALDYVLRGRAVLLKPPTPDTFREAINLLERASTFDPQSVEAQSWLAWALVGRERTGMSGSATADIARADGLVGQVLAVSPHNAFAHSVKGTVLRAQNRYEEAIPEFETALSFNRNMVNALHQLSLCKFWAGSMEEAIRLEEQAMRLSPRDPMIGWRYLLIGTVHLLQSRTDEAIVWLEKARSSVPAAPGVRSRLASAYGLKGKTYRAAAELAEARRLNSDGRFSSLARLRTSGGPANGYWGVPKTRALWEATYFAGLRKAGMPEE